MKTILRNPYSILLTLWLIIFGVEIGALSSNVSKVMRIDDHIEHSRQYLDQSIRQIHQMTKEMQEKSKDQEFLLGLMNIFPQDKGYLRTQKVISDEVQTLRKKIGRKIDGKLNIVIDTKANKLYLLKGLVLEWQADCSVGRGGTLIDKKSGQRWEFATPQGEFRVIGKIQNPVWIKPDWAFVESGSSVPAPNDPIRRVEGELGAYVLNLGDGYLIHGTKYEELLGNPVSHGCVRLGAENLEKLYQTVPIGTRVFIY